MIRNPNNITWKQVFTFVVIVLLLVSVYFNFKPVAPKESESDKEVKQLRYLRDSALQFKINVSEIKQVKLQAKKDSALNVIKTLVRKDSVNKYYYAKEKAKIKNFTPIRRNDVLDSIFKSNGLN